MRDELARRPARQLGRRQQRPRRGASQRVFAGRRYTSAVFPVSDVIPSKTTPFVTVGLIVLNALVFLYELQLSRPELQLFVQLFGVVPINFTWASLFTSMFLHEGWMHLLGNMLYLWIFGDNVEDQLGHFGYLLFYLASGAAAALGQVMVSANSSIPMIAPAARLPGSWAPISSCTRTPAS